MKWRWSGKARLRRAPADAAALERARPIIERSARTYPNLAYRRDKALLFSPEGNALLMYGRIGRSWIAMGDPVGPEAEARALARRFRDECARRRRWSVFFEVRPEHLAWYFDLGLTLTQLGEEARVELAGFDLQRPELVRMRQARAKLAREGQGAGREELSVDLMRRLPDAPNGTMDLLFTELLLWGREGGYRWFNFGMAPLSGLDRRSGAPLWNRVATFVYRHGEHFYNFRGLRAYKEKFRPVWTPLYLASPGGAALPAVLLDVTALIAGGYGGIFKR